MTWCRNPLTDNSGHNSLHQLFSTFRASSDSRAALEHVYGVYTRPINGNENFITNLRRIEHVFVSHL